MNCNCKFRMTDSQSHSGVVKTIKNYVSKCGGDVTVLALVEDYKTSFRRDIPYSKFGYKSLIDFLISISGLTVKIRDDGQYHLQTRRSTSTDAGAAAAFTSTDMSSLCVEMKNNLIFLDSAAKRKVTVKESNALKPSRNPLKRYDSSHSVRSDEYVPSSGYCSDNYSAANSSFDPNSSRLSGNDYSSANASFDYNSGRLVGLDYSAADASFDYDSSRLDFDSSRLDYDTSRLGGNDYSVADASFDYNSSRPVANDYGAFELQEYATVDQNVPLDATNYEYYDSRWQQPYQPQRSVYDSSTTYGNGSADSTFADSRGAFAEHPSAVDYDRWFASSYVPDVGDLDCPNQPPPVTDKQVVNRLVALVNAHQTQISSSAVEFEYTDSYADALPKNWLALLEESNALFVEHLTSGTVIYPNRTLPSIPTMLDLPKLDLPAQMPWSVSVTVVRSVDSVWFRVNENDLDRRYQILRQQMRKHYRNASPAAILSVEEGQLFAARFESKLLRVCVLDRAENGACKCLAIDEGFSEVLPLTSLVMLHEKFTNTPKLILHGSLAGLSKYAECSRVRERLEKMVVGADTSVVVDKCEAAKFSMSLFVTKDDSGGVNVNDQLLEVIEKELSPPKLEVDRIFDVLVLSLSIANNVAKVQIKSPCLELLRQSLRECARIIEGTDRRLLFAKNLIDVQLNQLYLAKYSDGSWQRVLVKQFVNSTHVVVVFVDFQDIQALEITKIICYANFPDALTYIPPQGVTVNIVKTNPEILKLMNLKLATNSFSMKVVQTDPKLCVRMYLKVPQEARDEDFSKQFRCSAV